MNTEIRLTMHQPEITLAKGKEGAEFLLTCARQGGEVSMTLTEMSLRALATQAETLLPPLKSALTRPEIEASFRQSGGRLLSLDDRAWQTLLREVPSDTLVRVLWYLKNPEIGQAVFRNVSERVAVILLEELTECYQGKNPDTVPEAVAILGREALAEILETLDRLREEGRITCC